MSSTSTDLWFKFYPKDWNGDHQLRMCSLAARGIWAGCLELMHTAIPYGHLLVNGKNPTADALAVILTCRPREAEFLLSELIDKGVASRTTDGVIFSRRMVRDGQRRQLGSECGKESAAIRRQRYGTAQPLGPSNHPSKGTFEPPFEGDLRDPLRRGPSGPPSNLEARSQKLEARITNNGEGIITAPIPESTQTGPAPVFGRGNPHKNHACCGRVCLHSSQFEDFTRKVGNQADPDAYVRQFFATWDDRYVKGDRQGETISEDGFDFWRERWAETHPPKKAPKPSETRRAVPSVDELRRKHAGSQA